MSRTATTAEGGQGPVRGGTCIPVKLCFQAVWLGWPGSQRCNTTSLSGPSVLRYCGTAFCGACTVVVYCEACRRLPDWLASVLNVAHNQTLHAGMAGWAGWACSLGNLRTLSGQFQQALGTRLGPRLDPSRLNYQQSQDGNSPRHWGTAALMMSHGAAALGCNCSAQNDNIRIGAWQDRKVAGSVVVASCGSNCDAQTLQL